MSRVRKMERVELVRGPLDGNIVEVPIDAQIYQCHWFAVGTSNKVVEYHRTIYKNREGLYKFSHVEVTA